MHGVLGIGYWVLGINGMAFVIGIAVRRKRCDEMGVCIIMGVYWERVEIDEGLYRMTIHKHKHDAEASSLRLPSSLMQIPSDRIRFRFSVPVLTHVRPVARASTELPHFRHLKSFVLALHGGTGRFTDVARLPDTG